MQRCFRTVWAIRSHFMLTSAWRKVPHLVFIVDTIGRQPRFACWPSQHHSLLKVWEATLFGIAISWQQNYKMVSFAMDRNHTEFEDKKMLSSHRALRCDKHQFHAKMTVSTQTVGEISLLNIVVLTRKKNNKNGPFCYHTLLRLAVFRIAFGQLYESCWSQRHSKRKKKLGT